MSKSLDELLVAVNAWQQDTFPRSDVMDYFATLKREIAELGRLPMFDPRVREEIADVAIVLFGLADRAGVDLASAIEWKLAINRTRRWGEPDAYGVIEHIDEASLPSGCDIPGALAESLPNSEPTQPESLDLAEFRDQAPAGARSGSDASSEVTG